MPARKSGRPLSFDRDAALRAAMLAFWQHGYETTSISDLKAAMNVTAPSIYTAFGDKRRLFLEAVALYRGDPAALAAAIASAPTAKDAARAMLHGAAELFTGHDTPAGCLLASATASGSDSAADVQQVIASIRREIAETLAARISDDVAAGYLPAATDAQLLAWSVICTIQGMSGLARDGLPRQALVGMAEVGLNGWPNACG